VAILNASKVLDKLEMDGDAQIGVDILRRALRYPAKQLAENAGLNGDIVVERVLGEKKGIGFNVLTGEYVDMVKAGILDPAKVTKAAVLNAVSVSGLLLTTGAMVAQFQEGEDPQPMPSPDMGGMY